MEPSGQRDLRLTLAGLQAGCLGALLMIGWWLLGEALQRRSPWTIPNLLATTFYGEGAYRSGFFTSTWSGLAGPLVVYCTTGVVFALAGKERKAGWVLLLVGAATGLALYWLFFGLTLRALNPLIQIYSPDRLLAVSHLLYGLALATYPGFARDLLPAAETPRVSEVEGPNVEVATPPDGERAGPDPPESDQEVGRSIP